MLSLLLQRVTFVGSVRFFLLLVGNKFEWMSVILSETFLYCVLNEAVPLYVYTLSKPTK